MTPCLAPASLKYWCKGEPSEVGVRVARLLADWVGGCHHLPCDLLSKVDWLNQRFIEIKADSSITGGDLASFDFDALTRLVFLAHDRCIRVSITPLGKQTLRLLFHPRDRRDGSNSERHPTIEQALAKWRESNPSVGAVPALEAGGAA